MSLRRPEVEDASIVNKRVSCIMLALLLAGEGVLPVSRDIGLADDGRANAAPADEAESRVDAHAPTTVVRN